MTEAGWYADPEGHGRGRRYWDGSQWTEHYEHPAPAQQAAPAPAPQPVVQQQAPAQQLPPAGWKDDPEGGEGLRYWDGQQWTDHYHPPRDQAPAAASSSFEPASQAFQPSTGSEPAVQAAPAAGAAAAAAATPSPGSLDETQLDVRGYHGGRPEEPSAAPETEPSAADATPATPAERQAQFEGLLYAPIVMSELLAGLHDVRDRKLEVHLSDTANRSQPFFHAIGTVIEDAGLVGGGALQPRFRSERALSILGRDMVVSYNSTPEFEATINHYPTWLLLLGGSMVSLLLALLVWLQGSGLRRAEGMAQRMTTDLEHEDRKSIV